MKPIYWSPVHDVSSVVRGTWFYKETMLPVESDVANQLEKGFEYMKPEPLTPEEKARKHAAQIASTTENKAAGILDDVQSAEQSIRLYPKSSVIYANGREAQILRSRLLPSVARGYRPLGPIVKGKTIGIPVVRGFDHKAWDKLYPPRKGSTIRKAQAGATLSQSGAAATMTERDACPACLAAENRPKVTDLVLVIHGYLYRLYIICL